MSAISSLADEFHAFYKRTDQMEALWKGSLDDLEMWEDFTPAAVDQRRAELRRFVAQAEELSARAGQHPTLDLISFAAGSTDEQLEWYHDLLQFNSNMGFHPMLLTFGPRFPLVTAEHGERYLTRMANLPATLRDFAARISSAGSGTLSLYNLGQQIYGAISQVLGKALLVRIRLQSV